jgi:DivIVA domain-containing protein
MDLSPEVINEVEFSMARRGYDPDQVDEFLEKVAVAVGEMGERLTEARERAIAAERRANDIQRKVAGRAERADEEVSESVSAQAEAELETLKRTLVLAQRTADAAMREAEQEAARLRAEAQEESNRLISAAEGEAREAHESTRQALIAEIGTLETDRDGLRDDVRALERHIDEQRLRLRGSITELQRILDDPARLKAATPPIPVDVPAAPVTKAAPAPLVVEDELDLDVELPPAADRPRARAAAPVAPAVAEDAETDAEDDFEGLGLDIDDADDDAWARFSAPDDDIDAGPPTEPVLRLDDLAARAADDDDAYLAELRKAMLEDTGAPDVDDPALLEELEDRPARSRFGRRR